MVVPSDAIVLPSTRVQLLRQSSRGWMIRVLSAIGVVGVVQSLAEFLGPDELQEALRLNDVLPNLSGQTWLAGSLVVLLVVSFEATFRVVRQASRGADEASAGWTKFITALAFANSTPALAQAAMHQRERAGLDNLRDFKAAVTRDPELLQRETNRLQAFCEQVRRDAIAAGVPGAERTFDGFMPLAMENTLSTAEDLSAAWNVRITRLQMLHHELIRRVLQSL